MSYCDGFHSNYHHTIVSSYNNSRASILDNYNSRYQSFIHPASEYIVQLCNNSDKVDLLNILALLPPLLIPFNVEVASVIHAVDLLKTVQYVEYEDLSDTDRNQLHQQTTTRITTFLWVKIFDWNQPSATELIQLLATLVDVCGHLLIFDLLKLIHGYLSANPEKLQIDMPIDVFDSSFKWRIAIVKCIVSSQRDNFIRIHYIGWDCKYDEWISVHSVRIRLLRNKYSQIVREWQEFEIGFDFVSDVCKSQYDFHNCTTGTWERCTISQYMVLTTNSLVTTHWNPNRDLAPAGTFT